MGNFAVSFIDGSLFALGLGISGMTSPVKVVFLLLYLSLARSLARSRARVFSQPLAISLSLARALTLSC
jgi:hypothetical protein